MGFLNEVPIFKYISPEDAKALELLFVPVKYSVGEKVLQFAAEVPGLYVVSEGIVSVFTEAMDAVLAEIERGGSFGEMSLVEEGQRSSANIIVKSPIVVTHFCERGLFSNLLKNSASTAYGFYHGAAELLSRRLRNTNEGIGKQLDMAQKLILEISKNTNLAQHLGKTRSHLEDTGSNVVGQLLGIVMELSQLSKSIGPEQPRLEELTQRIENLVLKESQSFDVISQQLDLIYQYFNNMRLVLKGEPPKEIRGDLKLLER